jgi:hypothetical protein
VFLRIYMKIRAVGQVGDECWICYEKGSRLISRGDAESVMPDDRHLLKGWHPGLEAVIKPLIAEESKRDFGQTRDAKPTGHKVIRQGMGPRPTHSKEFPAIPDGGFACTGAIH